MGIVSTKGSNGVSYGYRHLVTAQDAIDGFVTIDFNISFPIVASATVYDATGIAVPFASNADTTDTVTVTPAADGIVTYPALGQIKIANGVNFSLVAGYRIDIVAQFARGDI